ncbi:hypothetical protein HJC23_002625 [Cyclotella cryptica]|uniref:SUN domain-containing protein n=1 Tax=Cyclotella cryptica TaxID=29204 RepID=A0ABD3PXB8_9STRA|eukprot:CCRYP_010379-RB/>CCRYP_010379-RB protein AED:0.00 eAED:0.00 QI:200/-1/1/1/-1/1/1/67/731
MMTTLLTLLALLPIETLSAATTMQQKQQQLAALHSQIHSQMDHFQKVTASLSQNVDKISSLTKDQDRHDESANPNEEPTVEQIYSAMDETSHKLATLLKRTRSLIQRVGEYNKMSLMGNYEELGLKERLKNLFSEEMERRDRFMEWKSSLVDAENDLGSNVDGSGPSSPYISLEALRSLLEQEKIMQPTEVLLTNSIMEYTQQTLRELKSNESLAGESALSSLEKKYSHQFHKIMEESKKEDEVGMCVDIPKTVEMVERELELFYLGGVNMTDYASYEMGGSVVHSLTSAAYRPRPRNDGDEGHVDDKAVESMYFEQRHWVNDDSSEGGSIRDEIHQWMEKMDLWEWYTLYKLGGLRDYLPQDWERTIDWVYNRISTSNEEWDNYTPRGLTDALVPSYVYHSLGLGNYAQTASPEVAITSGPSKSGGEVGVLYSSRKQLGNCYPLSMHPDDDPALSYLSRHVNNFEGEMDEGITSLLSGPKYTVRLSQPIYIDAVSLEHRSFPIPKAAFEGRKKGGESAPRYVRLVGFPPCSDVDNEECKLRGFDITRPIDLGNFEYQRVLISGGNDDYGDIDDKSKVSDRTRNGLRRRSIQTFRVKGGTWEPPSMDDKTLEDVRPTRTHETDESQCSFDDLECSANETPKKQVESEVDPIAKALATQGGGGECAPNYDDIDSFPSCGVDNSDSYVSSSSSSENNTRHIVAAVSFIIEENWGNEEYTCLYRLQVHGDVLDA